MVAAGPGLLPVRRALLLVGGRYREVVPTSFEFGDQANVGACTETGDRRCGGIPDPAQPLGREIEGFYVITGLPQVPQRRQVDSFPASGLRALVVVFGFGGRGREQFFGRRRLLVPGDVVRPRPAVVRSFPRTTAPTTTAWSYSSGTRGISHSSRSWPGRGRGRCARISRRRPIGSGTKGAGRRVDDKSGRANRAV